MKILVTGGAGYIGSHIALGLIDKNIDVVVLDNLSTGFKKLIPERAKFIKGDYANLDLLNHTFNNNEFNAVMHCAGDLKVEESVRDPHKYYYNNTFKTLQFIKFLSQTTVKNIIFSSTAAVYDINNGGVVNESSKLEPINPYGSSKLMSERIIQDIAKVSGFNFFILRYFNVAGCDLLHRSGQMHENATHLIKVCVECALNKREIMEIYGNQHKTKDGTCVRDYIHISDLVSGHLIALEHLVNNGNSDICNLGYGSGYSVLEIVNRVKKLSGNNFDVKFSQTRDGDPPVLISNSKKMKELYKWYPKYNDIDKIINSTLSWEKRVTKSEN